METYPLLHFSFNLINYIFINNNFKNVIIIILIQILLIIMVLIH